MLIFPIEGSDWRILRIRATGTLIEYFGDVYDTDGNLIRTRFAGKIDGLAKFVHHNRDLTFSVTRPAENRLVISLEESLCDGPVGIEVVVGKSCCYPCQ